MSGYVFLGSSYYALTLLNSVHCEKSQKVIGLFDKNMTSERKNQILKKVNFLKEDQLFEAKLLECPTFLTWLEKQDVKFAFSVYFMMILKEEFLKVPQYGVVNLHPSLLPHNRGNWPEVCSILKGTPAGVTLHYMDSGIDTGDIIQQAEVELCPEDTSETLGEKLEQAGIQLTQDMWKYIGEGRVETRPQKNKLPLNTNKKVYQNMEIRLDKNYKGEDLIRVLRAFTSPKYFQGAYFIDEQTHEKIFLNLSLKREK